MIHDFQTFTQFFKKDKVNTSTTQQCLAPGQQLERTLQTPWGPSLPLAVPCIEAAWGMQGSYSTDHLAGETGVPGPKEHRLRATPPAGRQPPCKEYGFKEDPYLWEIKIALTDTVRNATIQFTY